MNELNQWNIELHNSLKSHLKTASPAVQPLTLPANTNSVSATHHEAEYSSYVDLYAGMLQINIEK